MNPNRVSFVALLALLLLAACTERPASSNPASSDADPPKSETAVPATASVVATNTWLGQWNGPEGTFLRLAEVDGAYKITIQNLDGPLSYTGQRVAEAIQFERAGVVETIRHTNGEQTGMKWLVDKKNCLTVRRGEGYCRD